MGGTDYLQIVQMLAACVRLKRKVNCFLVHLPSGCFALVGIVLLNLV